jgi:hypothetical protein
MEPRREYRLAEVEALDPSTAHPSPEAWRADRPASPQGRMRRVHAAHRAGRPGRTVVVVPSRTVE